MNILLTGASGLIGSALAPALARQGHQVTALRRQADGPGPHWNPPNGALSLEGAAPWDAVIHLAGETIAQRWTPSARIRIRASRVDATRKLSEALSHLPQPPRVMICASAIGYYGDRGEAWLDETSASGTGFLAEICRDWEDATKPLAACGTRVVNLRLGLVLTPKGGALAKMLPFFNWCLGGCIGSGRQYWSWITLADLLQVFSQALNREDLRGPVNAVSPGAVTNAEFTQALAAALQRPAFLPMPSLVVRLALGKMGVETMLASTRVMPEKLIRTEFPFEHPELSEAAFQV
jgi:uncharacterized protein (TIGR01777 family)